MNDLEIIPQSTDLSVRFSDTAVEAMKQQREQLKSFVQSQMIKDSDYGVIPGTNKPSLYKPGAEKLANIFQLGSRVVSVKEVIDHDKNYAMFTYTVEVFHIPTGKAIAQCQGSTNSFEKKYKEKSVYEWVNGVKTFIRKEPISIGDILNTLQKMAQKRAHVGAIISAVGASDFFTQDVEDLKGTGMIPDDPKDLDPDNYVLKYGRAKGKLLKEATRDQLQGFVKWFKGQATPITAPAVVREKELVEAYLNTMDCEPPKFDDTEQIPF